MTRATLSVLLAGAIGCASDVDLPLDPGPDGEDPPGEGSDPPPEWSRADFPAPGWVEDLVWTTDGALVATIPVTHPRESPPRSSDWTLTRLGPDGAIEWKVDASRTDVFDELAAVEGGGVIVSVHAEYHDNPSPLPAGLLWYDADGSLTASWRPSDEEIGDLLIDVSSFLPLPDGGVFWTGSLGQHVAPVAGLLDAERRLEWLVPLPIPADSDLGPSSDVAVTADGDFVVLASAQAREVEQPDRAEADPAPVAYLAQLAPDGQERWLTELVGSQAGEGLRVASSGNLLVTGTFHASMSVGDLVLEGDQYPPGQFVAEIDAAGQARGLHAIELPAWLVAAGSHFKLQTMTAAGDHVMIAGSYFADDGGPLALTGFLATTHQLDGALVAESVFARQEAEGMQGGGTGPGVMDVGPDGRLAVGGTFGGSVDFGGGVVDGGVDDRGFSLAVPFISVFEQSDDDVD